MKQDSSFIWIICTKPFNIMLEQLWNLHLSYFASQVTTMGSLGSSIMAWLNSQCLDVFMDLVDPVSCYLVTRRLPTSFVWNRSTYRWRQLVVNKSLNSCIPTCMDTTKSFPAYIIFNLIMMNNIRILFFWSLVKNLRPLTLDGTVSDTTCLPIKCLPIKKLG